MKFTQYLMPDGRKKEVSTERSPDIEAKAKTIREWGGEFEVEMLTTGDVSMTVEYDDDEGERQSLAHEIVVNGPLVPIAVDRLVETAFLAIQGKER
jgi:hypothetical protein